MGRLVMTYIIIQPQTCRQVRRAAVNSDVGVSYARCTGIFDIISRIRYNVYYVIVLRIIRRVIDINIIVGESRRGCTRRSMVLYAYIVRRVAGIVGALERKNIQNERRVSF